MIHLLLNSRALSSRTGDALDPHAVPQFYKMWGFIQNSFEGYEKRLVYRGLRFWGKGFGFIGLSRVCRVFRRCEALPFLGVLGFCFMAWGFGRNVPELLLSALAGYI